MLLLYVKSNREEEVASPSAIIKCSTDALKITQGVFPMKVIASLFGILLVVLLLLGLGGALVFLMAYGLGLGINLIADFEPFQATVLGMLSIAVAGFLANRIWDMVRPAPVSMDDEDDYDDDLFEEFDDEEDEDEEPDLYPGIPRWRQPLKALDFSSTKPDDRCPCGSGRKYKNCHGSKRAN
jgi:hypothetical protein